MSRDSSMDAILLQILPTTSSCSARVPPLPKPPRHLISAFGLLCRRTMALEVRVMALILQSPTRVRLRSRCQVLSGLLCSACFWGLIIPLL